MILIGTHYGSVFLHNINKNESDLGYATPQANNKEDVGKKVLDICFNPGEDVFLVH